MALSEIPAEMPGLTDNSTSFREEILSSLLFTGDEEGFVLRAEKLRGCLESVATDEHSGAIEELKLLVAELVNEASSDEENDEAPGVHWANLTTRVISYPRRACYRKRQKCRKRQQRQGNTLT